MPHSQILYVGISIFNLSGFHDFLCGLHFKSSAVIVGHDFLNFVEIECHKKKKSEIFVHSLLTEYFHCEYFHLNNGKAFECLPLV